MGATKDPFGFAGCELLRNIDVCEHYINVLLTHLIRFFIQTVKLNKFDLSGLQGICLIL